VLYQFRVACHGQWRLAEPILLQACCVPCSSSAHRAPGEKDTVPIYMALVRPGRGSNSRSTSTEADALTTRPRAGQHGSGLIAFTPVSDVSTPTFTNGVWSLLWWVSVAQKNGRLTMLYFIVQYINLPVEYMAWRFRVMRQSNGCLHLSRYLVQPRIWLKNFSYDEKEALNRLTGIDIYPLCTVIVFALHWESHKSLQHDRECLTELLERACFQPHAIQRILQVEVGWESDNKGLERKRGWVVCIKSCATFSVLVWC